jgi:hypothetical protein
MSTKFILGSLHAGGTGRELTRSYTHTHQYWQSLCNVYVYHTICMDRNIGNTFDLQYMCVHVCMYVPRFFSNKTKEHDHVVKYDSYTGQNENYCHK